MLRTCRVRGGIRGAQVVLQRVRQVVGVAEEHILAQVHRLEQVDIPVAWQQGVRGTTDWVADLPFTACCAPYFASSPVGGLALEI